MWGNGMRLHNAARELQSKWSKALEMRAERSRRQAAYKRDLNKALKKRGDIMRRPDTPHRAGVLTAHNRHIANLKRRQRVLDTYIAEEVVPYERELRAAMKSEGRRLSRLHAHARKHVTPVLFTSTTRFNDLPADLVHALSKSVNHKSQLALAAASRGTWHALGGLAQASKLVYESLAADVRRALAANSGTFPASHPVLAGWSITKSPISFSISRGDAVLAYGYRAGALGWRYTVAATGDAGLLVSRVLKTAAPT